MVLPARCRRALLQATGPRDVVQKGLTTVVKKRPAASGNRGFDPSSARGCCLAGYGRCGLRRPSGLNRPILVPPPKARVSRT